MLRIKELSGKFTICFLFFAIVSINAQDSLKTNDSVPTQPQSDTVKSAAIISKTPPADETVSAFQLKTVVKIPEKKGIVGVCVKDVDNDQKNETIILTRGAVEVTRFANKTLQTLSSFKAPSGVSFVSIDIADINGNGAYEFFISAVNATFEIYQSMVLEFSNGKFTILKKRCGYQFRVVNEVNGGSTLLGQKYSSRGVQDGDLFVMGLNGGELVEKNRVGISDKAVHGFACIRDYSDSTSAYAVYGKNGFVEILDRQSGSRIAVSENKFGDSPFAIKLPSHSLSNPALSTLPVRIVSFDCNNDGIDEIVCVQNNDALKNLFAATKIFNQTHFEVLSFDKNEGLVTAIWKSGVYSGFISDIAVGDIDNDGINNVIVTKLEKTDINIFKKESSEVIVFSDKGNVKK